MSLAPFDEFVLDNYRVMLAPGLTSSWIISYERPDMLLYWMMTQDALGLGLLDVEIWASVPCAAKTFRTRDEAILVLSKVIESSKKTQEVYQRAMTIN